MSFLEKPFDGQRKNIYSQNGEDGVISSILAQIGTNSPENCWCVEFGAWDGKHLSNTFALVERGWNAVYIEGDEIKFQDHRQRYGIQNHLQLLALPRTLAGPMNDAHQR